METAGPTAVLLINYGGPERMEECLDYVRNIFSDPDLIPIPGRIRPLVARVAAWRRAPVLEANYRAMGRMSPILEQTREQAGALEKALGSGYRCFVGMRYWRPLIAEAVSETAVAGCERAVLLPLYPQESAYTTGSALREARRCFAALAPGAALAEIRSFWSLPGFLETMAEGLREALARLPAPSRVLYCAHGLPEKAARGDAYPGQIASTVEALRQRAGSDAPWALGWQSQVGPMRWLRPSVEEVLRRWGSEGVRGAALIPVSFVSEHSETLYELDILYAGLSREMGMDVARVPTVRCAPAFISGLAGSVREAAAAPVGRVNEQG